jgi:hypothetical protein
MISRAFLGFAAALALVFGMLVFEPAGTPPASAQSDACSVSNFASSLGRSAGSIGGADQQAMLSWCRDAQSRETGTAMRTASSGTTGAKGPTQLKAEPKVAEIWCGKNNCLCWKGKKYNGCTNLSACATKLNCVGTICGCTTK